MIGSSGGVPSLRDSVVCLAYPGLPSWAHVCRPAGPAYAVADEFGATQRLLVRRLGSIAVPLQHLEAGPEDRDILAQGVSPGYIAWNN